jgi:hypothetical protein
VEDAHGAADTQSYTLAVTVSNLPPEILSAPVVDGAVGQPYVYVVEAVDPNGDPLTYSLEMAPVDMEIEAMTGIITWMPTTRGEVAVVVRVQDGHGAAATQSYTLRTLNWNRHDDATLCSVLVLWAAWSSAYSDGRPG